ncbi:hypothetical protein SAMN02910357_02454 [Succinivibrio dextrinosolvens]|uniref:hypothetical protein n=1 Tax=Succinivibrio dextrinosolvens TaxID=83771 RepID=UPI0008F0DB0F|nr:hypothetical protein [Succinivibrio dextrinosolvens]SFS89682.1 hypothetical protein SAMN02910357_02454 [Succinivibrio dextrinosolvens]
MKKKTLVAVISLSLLSVTCSNAADNSLAYTQNNTQSVYVQKIGIEQDLQGSWFGTNGKDSMMLIFMNNMVGLALNNQQIYGNYTVNGNQLNMQFQNGKSLSYTMKLNGDVLILDNITLHRHNMQQPQNNPNNGGWGNSQVQNDSTNTYPQQSTPQSSGGWGGGNTNNGMPQNNGAPQGGSWGGNDVAPQNNGYGANALTGRWSSMTPQGEFAFQFSNNQYVCFVNNQQIETGTYQYDPASGNFNFRITSGQAAGSQGTNRIFVQGNTMTIQFQNGGQMNFQKSY